MKTRNGFVSNSSSSSFIIYRKLLTKDNLKKINEWWTANADNIYDDDGAGFYDGNYICVRCHSHSTQFDELLIGFGLKKEDYMCDYK